MDPYSSGEETILKTRKPYTITKQRERWTEEEHNRFLEALKLHGRTWQRIEEHIGTKTAVQIRSHAQKFFTKLEKEALVKGVPVRQALDIEIPPPRPKRKPCNPYPRKGSSSLQLIAKDGKSVTSLSSLHCVKDVVLDLEKEPIPEKSDGDGTVGNVNKDQDEENYSEPFSFMQDASSASLSLANKISMSAINSSSFREFVPVLEKVNNGDLKNESYITIEPRRRNQKSDHEEDKAASTTSKLGNSHPLHEQLVEQDHNPDDKLGNFGAYSIKGGQNYPRHVPVHIVDGSLGSGHNISSSEISYQEQEKGCGQTNIFGHKPAFTTSEHHSNASRLSTDEIFPAFHPLLTPPVPGNQDDLLNMSSTFCNLIISTLLQNPSAHAAARFAATFWPCANMEASSSETVTVGPSIAAIAGATVAAATAWWAAHGLLPPPPIHQLFTCPPPPPPPPPPSLWAPPRDNCQPNNGGDNNTATPPEEGILLGDASTKVSLQQQSGSNTELGLVDSSKAKIRKQVNRSSCGSNTASSSDIETDALEKNEKAKDELKEADASPSSDSSNCRSRSYITLNDSWKEVSEEGRLAFHALFSREVLPQSFSPPLDALQQKTNMVEGQTSNIEQGQQNMIQSRSHVDLNTQQPVEMTSLRGDENGEGMLSIGLGQMKVKVHRTGFKPYKRYSVEAKESRMACTRGPNDEKVPKRMRLGAEAST